MRRYITRSVTLIAAATFLSSVPALSQTQGQAQTQAQDAAGTAATAQTGADPLDPGVEVSLGRTEIKQQLATELGLPIADVPMSVHVPLDLATRVCGQEVFDSELDNNRSCTVTHFAPELVAIAQESLRTDAPSQAPGAAAPQGTGTAPSGSAATYTRWSKLRDAGGAAQGGDVQPN